MKEFPPMPKWKPSIKPDLKRIIKTFKYYSSNKVNFVVFENGTIVPLDNDSKSYENDAKSILTKLFYFHPDFNPLQMDDGNWLISMSNNAYVICFKDVIEKNWVYIDKNHLDGLATSEVLLNSQNKPNIFDERGKIGLFGRAYWFLDAISTKVKEIVVIKNGK